MAEEKRGWKRFQRLSFDSQSISNRARNVEGATIRHARKFIFQRLENVRGVRRQIIGWLFLVAVLIAVVAFQTGWFQQDYRTQAAARGGTYAEASFGEIETLNPLYSSSSSETAAARLLFSSLYTYDEAGALRGDLATTTSISKNGRVYTVSLRPDAQWSDGTKLTANDVAFTVNLIKDPAVRSPLRINWQDITVEALDDQRVQFTLPAAYAAFPHALTFAVLPQHILRDVQPAGLREAEFSRSPVGSGPFRFVNFQNASAKHKIVQMSANDTYYGGTPRLARFEVHSYSDTATMLQALRSGEVSAASNLSLADTAKLGKNQNITTIAKPVNSGVYAIFNNGRPALKDSQVRQALRSALDTEQIRKQADPAAPKLSLPILESQVPSVSLPGAPIFDPSRAARQLDRAGWKLRDGVRKKGQEVLRLTLSSTKESQYDAAAKVITSNLKAVGVEVETTLIDTNDPNTNIVRDVLQPRNFDILIYELSIGGDPDVYAYWHSSQIGQRGYNFANYSNGTSDDNLTSARSTLDPKLRDIKYQTFVRRWLQDAPAVGLYQQTMRYTYSKQVTPVLDKIRYVSPYSRFVDVLEWSVDRAPVYKTP